MKWSMPPVGREQMTLFARSLDDIGAQMAIIAHQMGVTTLTKLVHDGTRLRASMHAEPLPTSKS